MLYNVYTRGDNPNNATNHADIRAELAFVEFEPKKWAEMRPLRIMAALPRLDASSKPQVVKPLDEADEGLEAMAKRAIHNQDRMVVMNTIDAAQNPDTGRCTLDFGGRVTEASVKNMQMTVQGGDNSIILQFGKCGKDNFIMD